jgi:hypothetical protein
MPRGRTKEILHTARFEQAAMRGPLRICRGDRQNHSIPRGSWCLTIKDGLGEKSYCLECARAILERGRVKLNALFAELQNAEP